MSNYLVAGFSGPARSGVAKIIYCGDDQAAGVAEAEKQKDRFQSFGRLANPMWIPVSVEPIPQSGGETKSQPKSDRPHHEPTKSKPTLRA